MTEAEFRPVWLDLLQRHPKQAERLNDQDWDDWLAKLSQYEPETVEAALQEWYKTHSNGDRKRFPELIIVANICKRMVTPEVDPERDTVATEAYCRANRLPIWGEVPDSEEAKSAYVQAHIDHCKAIREKG